MIPWEDMPDWRDEALRIAREGTAAKRERILAARAKKTKAYRALVKSAQEAAARPDNLHEGYWK